MRLFTPIGCLLPALWFAGMISAQETRQIPTNLSGYSPARDTLVYVGTYTGGKSASKGIYVFRLQTQNDEVSQNIMLVPLGLAAESPDPAFLELDPHRRLLFAVNEL